MQPAFRQAGSARSYPGAATVPGSAHPGRRYQDLPRRALEPVPLFLLRPLFAAIVAGVAGRHPELFGRLGPEGGKRILIDPVNLPFVLLLRPYRYRPSLTPHRRSEAVPHDARISGTFLTLLELIDGQADSDALFFSRDLRVDGDTAAIVALRNALDDMEVPLADDIAGHAGPLSRPMRAALGRLRTFRSSHR